MPSRQSPKIIESIEAHGSRPLTGSVLSYMPNKNSDLEGMPVSEIAKRRGKSLGEVVCDLLIEEDLQIAFWMAPPDNIYAWQQVSRDALEFLSRSDYMVGSDSIPLGSVPHPRAYGTFPRFLGRLRREFGTMSMEAMVQRFTDNAARRFGLTNRGRVTPGYFADITVFDAERIIDNATYDNPRQYAAGIPYVLVNGRVAVDHERCTGVLSGQAIP